MTDRPETRPTWGTTAGVTLEPSSGVKAAGWTAGTRPPARWENWLRGNDADWINWLTDRIMRLAVNNWTERANPQADDLNAICYGNGKFVAVGDSDGGDAYIAVATDGASNSPTGDAGHSWVNSANVKAFNLYDIVWSEDLGLFCAVGAGDGVDSYIITSPTGLTGTWTERAPTVPKNIQLNGICWSSELTLFCAVGEADGTDSYILTSPDGVTWTERAPTVSKNFALNAVAYSDELDLFVAVGDQDGADAYIVTSPDGVTWTERSNPETVRNLFAIDWSSTLNLFVVVGGSGTILTSPDGINWTEQTTNNPEPAHELYEVIWLSSFGMWLAFGQGMGNYLFCLLTSEDGVTWSRIPSAVVGGFAARGAALGPRTIVLVGDNDGADAMIFTSNHF